MEWTTFRSRVLLFAAAAVMADAGVGRAAPPYSVGANLDFNVDYATARTWADVTFLFNRWGQLGAGWNVNPNLQLTPDGMPLSDADSNTFMRGYPNGVYKMVHEGAGNVEIVGAQISNRTTANGRTTADITLNRSSLTAMVTLRITGIDRNNPVRNLHIYAPGYPTDGSRLFTDEFLKRVRPFKILRYMDWGRVNNSSVRTWADRVRPTAFNQNGFGGVAYEHMIALANVSGKDMWVCIPDQVDDDFIRQMARLFRDRLNPGINVYLEFSNEVWNGAFQQYRRMATAGRNNPIIGAGDDFTAAARQTAYKLKVAGDIWKAEWGARAGSVRPMLCGQSVNTFFLASGLQWLQGRYGNPSTWLAGIAIAPYPGGSLGSIDRPGLTMDALFAELNRQVDSTMNGVRSHKTLANQYGVPLLAYEGGQHMTAWSPTYGGEVNAELKIQANRDPRMGQFLRRLLDAWDAAGGGTFCHYSHIGEFSKWGSWALLENNYASTRGGPKWDYVMGACLPAGDLSLEGRVDFADFQVFRANYGKTGQFWEDGDFNHDGRVDRTDWTLMKPNLTGLTQAQAAEIAAWETGNGTGTGTLPTVRIASPAPGAGFIAGSNVTINAEATAGSGSIVRVEFFQGSTRLGEDAAAPYTFTWSNVQAGSYSLTARVVNSAGGSATSAPVSITVTTQSGGGGTPPPPPPPTGGTGTGLTGQYYDNPDLTGLRVTRNDATVNFDWGTGAPASGMTGDTYSVRWTGQVEPRYSGTYTFYTVSDDGVRLWVNGQLIINNWTLLPPTENSGTISLTAGQKADIRMEMYNAYGGGVARLLWQHANEPKAVVPTSQLYPAAVAAPPPSFSVSLEAESAQIGSPAFAKSMTGASGGRIVGNVGTAPNVYQGSGSVTFTVNAPAAGNYEVVVYNVCGDQGGRKLWVSRNGGSGTEFTCGFTGGWNVVGSATITLSLQAGNNTLRLYNTTSGGPDLDRIVVKNAP